MLQEEVKGEVNDKLAVFNARVKRNSEDETLEEATAKGNYAYWLSQEDIADIARLHYNNYKRVGVSSEFDVLGSILQLSTRIEEFKLKTRYLEVARLTLVINLANLHWVALMISYQNGNYLGYYVDSKDNSLPVDYYQLLLDHFQIQPISLRTDAPQQTDEYNCGLWALENAFSLNEMLDDSQPLHYVINELKQPRDREYFDNKRLFLSMKLRVDTERNARRLHHMGPVLSSLGSRSEPTAKRQRLFQTKEEKIAVLLETFVESFLSALMKRLAAYHLAAKGERLTDAALKVELKTGLTGGLLGVSISQGIIGSIPSLVASLRILSAKYYLSKATAQKITKAFSGVVPGELSPLLAEAAVAIFRSFESQFIQITDKAGDQVAMEKLAEDAVGRILNYLTEHAHEDNPISEQLIEKGLLLGSSEKFFDPSFKKVRIRLSGNTVQDKDGNSINTASLYAKVGLIVSTEEGVKKFYRIKDQPQSNQYGYRRLFSWETEENGELKRAIKGYYLEEQNFEEETVFQLSSRNYEYSLEEEMYSQEAQSILGKIKTRYSVQPVSSIRQNPVKKDSIFFDLRSPVENFVGRTEILREIHKTLLEGRTTAITASLSSLGLYPSKDTSIPQSGSQTAVSGLGGIGKTQLVLRYAQLHAVDYDNNVLWINAETKNNLVYSFNTLATKLQLETKDRYNHDKPSEEIAQEIYEYFSDRKSLFIFDNVENYKEIQTYLPKLIPGNQPSILITSRYSYWQNVASVISLGVFTEEESMLLIKKELNIMDNTQDEKIKELTVILQGLPLALQQALAYINLQKNINSEFSIRNYIELYKEKTEQLLNFDFSNYINDPYTKTVFTTWQITLEKIQDDKNIGKNALEILNIMAYLCPDKISNSLFLRLGNSELSSALYLLRSYSMISPGSQRDESTVHRLVQQVVRINIEMNPSKLREIIWKTENLIMDYETNIENRFHYLHLLLYMAEHTELKTTLQTGNTSRELFRILPQHDTRYWLYFLDLAYSKFPKERYLKFLGEALIYYSRIPSHLFLLETINYIEKKWEEGALSKENIKYILERRYYPNNPYYRLLTYLPERPRTREQQKFALELLYSLKEKLFKNNKEYLFCSAQTLRKRSVNLCRLSETERKRAKALDQQEIKTHLKNVIRLSDWLSSGLMTKDILAAFVQGEFTTVAADFSLLGGSILLGEISNKLLLQGNVLTRDSILLEKILALENKRALSIFLDKEVLAAAKKTFLGEAMKTASPFVARGTALLFAYNLINEIKDYEAGNEALLSAVVSDGIIVGIEGFEAGIEASEFLGLITGISEFTGPLGVGAVALVWFGSEAYHAKKQLEVIETQVHLKLIEKLKQSLRAFFHFPPSEYLGIKAANTQLAQNAVSFLKNHTEIKRYIFPSFYSVTALHEKSEIFLDKKRNLVLSDSMPDDLDEGHLFCLAGDHPDSITQWFKSETFTYLCKNAMGIEYLVNRTGQITFVNLERGDDEVLASPNAPTLFLVQDGKKMYRGGDKGNLFILRGDSITGLLQGGNGTDTLLLNDFHPKSDYLLHDSRGFLCGKNNSTSFTQLFCETDEAVEVRDIEQIYGKKDEKDILYVSQTTDFIDGYGGKNKEFPDYLYITPYSHRNPKLVLRNHSVILVFFNTGVETLSYSIPAGETGESIVVFSFTEAIQHQFFFDCALSDVRTMTIVKNRINFTLSSRTIANSTFSVSIYDFDLDIYQRQTNSSIGVPKHAYYFFKGIEIKFLNEDHIYAREYENTDNRTIDERINSFIKLAQRLGKAFSIQLMDDKSVFIGQKKHEIFYTNSAAENYLVGNVIGNVTDNDDENIYVVSATDAEFPLPKVVIYDSVQENLADFEILNDTLDLRKVVERAGQVWSGAIVSSRISEVGNDLTVELWVNNQSHLVNIILKNALLDNWYQKLNILLDTIPRSIISAGNESWALEVVPLTFDSDKEIIVLSSHDVENQARIFILKKIEDYRFFRDKNNLIITNIFSNPYDRCTILCKQFYSSQTMREKIVASTFSFFDRQLRPIDYLEAINQAASFSLITQHLEAVNQAASFSQLERHSITQQVNGTLLTPLLDEAIYHSVKKRSLDETLPQAPFAAQATSAATRTLPPIQGLLSWVKEKGIAFFSYANNAYVEFFIQKDYSLERKENLNSSLHLNHPKTYGILPLLEMHPELVSQQQNDTQFNRYTFNQVVEPFDLNGTLMLLDLIVRSFCNRKEVKVKGLEEKMAVNSQFFKQPKLPKTHQITYGEKYKNFNLNKTS
ncbi:MAG: NB-ARC domain-containing protein [Pseudomonadota bacterium]